jgi:hypothetical protein
MRIVFSQNFAKDLRKQMRPSTQLRANGIWIKPFDWAHDRPFVVSLSNHERRFKKESSGLFSGNWYNLKES